MATPKPTQAELFTQEGDATRLCTKCRIRKPLGDFYPCKRDRRGTHSLCKLCQDARGKFYNARVRREVLEAYGGRCQCCGEDTPEFLAIDHIHNDGAAERRVKRINLTVYVRRNGFPKDRFQLLCHNCNSAKSWFGVCPHELERQAAKEAEHAGG